MPWNPNVPTVTNRVQDDLDAIRENFQHLDQLAERVDELQIVSELAPIANDLQAVSGLAPVAGELQTVSELAPYVQALLDSHIVDHNLDVPNPPNGWYVRLDNGLQVCWGFVTLFVGDGSSDAKTGNFNLPAAFAFPAAVWAGNEAASWRGYQSSGAGQITSSFNWQAERKSGTWSTITSYPIHFIAVGRWK